MAGFVLPCLFVWLAPASLELKVRLCGMAWQLLGICVVLRGLRQRRRQFNRPMMRESLGLWVRDFGTALTGRSESVTIQANAGSIRLVGTVSTVKITRNALDARVADLEQAVDSIREDIAKHDSRVTREVNQLAAAVQRESSDRRSGDDPLQELVADVAAGRVHMERLGLVWLVLGVICTSVPDLLARVVALVAR